MLFNSIDPLISPILNLGVFLEIDGEANGVQNYLGFFQINPYLTFLTKFSKANSSYIAKRGQRICKGTATHASQNGDATCAEILCEGLGACKYVMKDGLGLSD